MSRSGGARANRSVSRWIRVRNDLDIIGAFVNHHRQAFRGLSDRWPLSFESLSKASSCDHFLLKL